MAIAVRFLLGTRTALDIDKAHFELTAKRELRPWRHDYKVAFCDSLFAAVEYKVPTALKRIVVKFRFTFSLGNGKPVSAINKQVLCMWAIGL